jgi:hypothetical protein
MKNITIFPQAMPDDLRKIKNRLESMDDLERVTELKKILKKTPVDELKRMRPVLKPYKATIDRIKFGTMGMMIRERLDAMSPKKREYELIRILSRLDLDDEDDTLNLRGIFYPYRKQIKDILKDC